MMQHIGDITKIDGATIEPVWCVTGGSPCQDLSIAGKRAGLAGARSGLFMEQIRVIKEMREHDRQLGRSGELIRPRYMVWENVPGALSSNKGRDFAAVLEETIRLVEPEAPSIEVPANMHRMVVRRLTPLECERLQGFPDGWTDIGDYTDSTGKKRKTSDSARYKALGNSIALPFWRWMFGRMAAYLPEGGATLGSLFDGIGGFPLCWEDVHGAGTAVWASEIEEFPIAVTKKRFGSENMIHYTLNIEPPVEPPAYICPICPVCGAETDTVYKNVYGDPVGCPECVTEVDAWAE